MDPSPPDTSSPASRHRRAARARRARVAVLTVSDSRTEATDVGGRRIAELLAEAGHDVVARDLVPDEPTAIADRLDRWLADERIDLVVTTGGTGIARRDTTVEVVERRLDKRLDGFGELFRMLSWHEVGAAAMLSRATAGLAGDTLVFALPGSPKAVELAMRRLIVPELPHLVWERER